MTQISFLLFFGLVAFKTTVGENTDVKQFGVLYSNEQSELWIPIQLNKASTWDEAQSVCSNLKLDDLPEDYTQVEQEFPYLFKYRGLATFDCTEEVEKAWELLNGLHIEDPVGGQTWLHNAWIGLTAPKAKRKDDPKYGAEPEDFVWSDKRRVSKGKQDFLLRYNASLADDRISAWGEVDEPNNFNGWNEACVELRSDKDGYMNDLNCSDTRRYAICEIKLNPLSCGKRNRIVCPWAYEDEEGYKYCVYENLVADKPGPEGVCVPCGRAGQRACKDAPGGPCLGQPWVEENEESVCVRCGANGMQPCASEPVCKPNLEQCEEADDTMLCKVKKNGECKKGKCGRPFRPSCDKGDACINKELVAVEGYCLPCGKNGRHKCDSEPYCKDGLTLDQETETCVKCGWVGQVPCNGDTCKGLRVVDDKTGLCSNDCGRKNQKECPAEPYCKKGFNYVKDNEENKKCVPCGKLNTAPCKESGCRYGLMEEIDETGKTICVKCGGVGDGTSACPQTDTRPSCPIDAVLNKEKTECVKCDSDNSYLPNCWYEETCGKYHCEEDCKVDPACVWNRRSRKDGGPRARCVPKWWEKNPDYDNPNLFPPTESVVCEYNTPTQKPGSSSITISCDEGYVLNVRGAFYGRDDTCICPYTKDVISRGKNECKEDVAPCLTTPCTQMSNTKCFDWAFEDPSRKKENVVEYIRGKCNGERFCDVSATNGLYGDPCVGTYKYVKVNYICTPATP